MVLNTIKEADLKGKRVVIRVDFNVPVKEGVVKDATRIKAALPTIKYILDEGASLVVMSHFGRPKGQKNPDFSMAPIAKEFEKLLGRPVKLAPDVIGPEVEAEVKALKPGEVLLLENVRFYKEEEANDEEVRANPEMLTKSRLLKLLIKKQYVKLREVTEEEQPADLAELLEELDENNRLVVFRLLKKDVATEAEEVIEEPETSDAEAVGGNVSEENVSKENVSKENVSKETV